jgi:mannose-6-phosphate isomerase-like protein (cupin superfamily)
VHGTVTRPEPTPATQTITLAEALERLAAEDPQRSVALFQHGSLSVKLYAPRGHDPQTPHSRDEAYVVANGRGVFFDGLIRRSFEPGTFLFAAAGQPHRFEDFTDDLAVWVLFYGPEGGEAPHASTLSAQE